MASDAVSIAPHVYSVVLENDRVRVLKVPDGSAIFMEAMDHSVENIGSREGHGFIIELK